MAELILISDSTPRLGTCVGQRKILVNSEQKGKGASMSGPYKHPLLFFLPAGAFKQQHSWAERKYKG